MAKQHSKSTNALEPWESLDGKIVLVTGASSGSGRDFCLDLAKAGCRIIAAARRVDRLNSLCDEINQWDSGAVRAVAVELDVTAKGSVIQEAIGKAWMAFGSIHVLINNAGVRGSVSSVLDLSEEEWDNTFKTNLTGTWLVSKYVCQHMHAANLKGSIINISSIAGLSRGQLPGGVAYAGSKAGVNIITRIMALELGQYNIRVNSISPGIFKSEITEKLYNKKWFKFVVRKALPLREIGSTDLALTSLVRYLIHDSSEYVSGSNFIVDSGFSLPGISIFSSL